MPLEKSKVSTTRKSSAGSNQERSNRLAGEKSPYLLQHANNPVDWYPWGEEAIRRAKSENKPIFLSIGYSSCHWCHVMEHESFEDVNIADLLNENFVCVKVDREERPDIDEVYMRAVMSMTGSAGWPLSVFLTPNLEPFFGGTYFPPVSRNGMPGFVTILQGVIRAWRTERKKVNESAARMSLALRQLYSFGQQLEAELSEGVFDDAFGELVASFDPDYGGFGRAPKFPTASNLFFLARYYKRTGKKAALQMLVKCLDFMASGGIHDQIGGGFHRYSTDRFWIVPHFEKMLYDNALLALAYVEGFLLTGDGKYRQVVEDTLNWVSHEMTDETASGGTGGGFHSAQDADSSDGEGFFYTWTKGEIRDALGHSSAFRSGNDLGLAEKIVFSYFSVTDEGNFEDGRNILSARKSSDQVARELGIRLEDVQRIVEEARAALLETRMKRPRPFTDDKVITSWNGLMISAMSRAYQVFGEEKFVEAALRAAEFILRNLVVGGNGTSKGEDKVVGLRRRYRQGDTKEQGLLEDYAFLANGLVDLYESCFEPKFIETAVALADTMIGRFYDAPSGGFFQTVAGLSDLIARPKDAFDGAMPSGNSMAALVLLRLSEFTGRQDLRQKAKATFEAFAVSISNQPTSFTQMLVALDFYLSKPKEIVISGDASSDSTEELLKTIRGKFLPNSVVAFADERLLKLLPLLEARIPAPDSLAVPRAYVCTNYSCNLPSSNSNELSVALDS